MTDESPDMARAYSPIRTSAQTDRIDAAMAVAQADLENPTKTKTAKVEGVSKTSGKEYKIGYAYTDIAGILADCRPILAKAGIALYQVPVIAGGGSLMIVTRLSCSGQWIEGDYPVCKIGGDHQEMGKAMTYARRYALGAMIGIAPENDTDGVGAAPPSAPDREPPYRAPANGGRKSSAAVQAAKAAIIGCPHDELDGWLTVNANAMKVLSADDRKEIEDFLAETMKPYVRPAQEETPFDDDPNAARA